MEDIIVYSLLTRKIAKIQVENFTEETQLLKEVITSGNYLTVKTFLVMNGNEKIVAIIEDDDRILHFLNEEEWEGFTSVEMKRVRDEEKVTYRQEVLA